MLITFMFLKEDNMKEVYKNLLTSLKYKTNRILIWFYLSFPLFLT